MTATWRSRGARALGRVARGGLDVEARDRPAVGVSRSPASPQSVTHVLIWTSCSGQDHAPGCPKKGSMQSAGHVGQGAFSARTGSGRGSFRGSAEGIFQSNPGPSPPRSFGAVRTGRDQVHGNIVPASREPMAAIVGAWMPELAARRSALRAVTCRWPLAASWAIRIGRREAAAHRAARTGPHERRARAGTGLPGVRPTGHGRCPAPNGRGHSKCGPSNSGSYKILPKIDMGLGQNAFLRGGSI